MKTFEKECDDLMAWYSKKSDSIYEIIEESLKTVVTKDGVGTYELNELKQDFNRKLIELKAKYGVGD